ncbi:penicillin-binding protein 1C [Kordiimonas aestuarii]|uniref:penicillin-binding protein 1C n=1 Tax=Kordiimonas aestuarii TaxID=1005925 RepID=UPI0021D22675|nr:penicillin-binding protein 1C [Kordiimonas aestuarii]
MLAGLWAYRKWGLMGMVLGVLLVLVGVRVLDRIYPPDMGRYHATSAEVRAADGRLMRIFTVEDGLIRRAVTTEEVDPLYLHMLVAYEDKRFYEHGGVDFLALARAAWQAAANGEIVSGASTLTMQTARLLEPRPRTVTSKLVEMFRAWQLERRFTKYEILEIYLTLAPFGGNIEGIKAASDAYFGHDSTRLTPDEAALLVILPQSPTRFRPDRHAARARHARNKVLDRVAGEIGLDPHLRDLALSAPVPARRHRAELMAPHLAARLLRGGLKEAVVTTTDYDLQAELERLVRVRAGAVHRHASAAILVVDNRTRHVLAYVGSAGFGERARLGYVDMVTAVRSPGSTLKPFIYGMAFDRGLAHAETRVRDEERRFGTYAPSNFMDRHYGEISIREALVRSLNVPAVAVLDRLGPVAFTEKMRDHGVTFRLPGEEMPGLAVALGGVGMSLEGLVKLYAGLASDGQVLPLVFDAGQAAVEVPPFGEMLSAATRQTLSNILSSARPPEDRLPDAYQGHARRVAYKTGTSYGFRDAWAVGYDGDYTVGVWVGRADGTPLPGHFGASTAAPILFDVFDRLPAAGTPEWAAAPGDSRSFAALPPALKYFDRPERLMLAGAGSERLAITFPLTGSVVEMPKENMPLSLVAGGGVRPLQWFVDGQPLDTNRWSRHASYALQGEGFYQITVRDAGGQSSSATIRAVAGDALR